MKVTKIITNLLTKRTSRYDSKEEDFIIELENSERLYIPKYSNFYVEGGTSSGKSKSIIKPIIEQAATRGYAGVIYGYVNDDVCKLAYTALKRAKAKNNEIKTNFSFVNFTDMSKTVRVNPLSTRYIEDRLDVQDLVQNMMTNLSVNKGKGGDFWEKYGTAYIYGVKSTRNCEAILPQTSEII